MFDCIIRSVATVGLIVTVPLLVYSIIQLIHAVLVMM